MVTVKARLFSSGKDPASESAGRDYETTWYLIRLGASDKFPDGREVPAQKWKTLKPIWIKLGEGDSWAKAITFGPAKETMYEAAQDFGAEGIVWLEENDYLAGRGGKINA